MAAILVIESLATLLNHSGSTPILVIGAARSLEIIFLIGICCMTESNGIKALGILPKHVLSGLHRGLLWSAGFGLMVGLVAAVLSIAGLRPLGLIAANLPSTQPGLFFFFLVGGIISPLAEEVFFRGMLYGYFRRWGMWAAILLSTAVFVMAHAILHRIPLPQIVGGILFALAYEKERNLLVPITIHVLGNLAIFAVALLNRI